MELVEMASYKNTGEQGDVHLTAFNGRTKAVYMPRGRKGNSRRNLKTLPVEELLWANLYLEKSSSCPCRIKSVRGISLRCK